MPGLVASVYEKSQILSLDVIYDLTERWSIGAKLAYHNGHTGLYGLNHAVYAIY